ncbi:MAG TPA: sodium-independent anion transporter, partial [Humibacillus sp.]|nr:sodium-independent anion transporter [Humibacillus sp.]
SVDALEELRRGLSDEGIVFAMARVKQDLRTSLEAGGLVAAVGEDRIFPTLPAAVVGYAGWFEDEHGFPPPGLTIPPVPPTPAG